MLEVGAMDTVDSVGSTILYIKRLFIIEGVVGV